jgi:L-malate glycosyltransferase
MKILLLGDGGSAHIQKWVSSLTQKDIEIGLFSLNHFNESIYKDFPRVTILNNPVYRNSNSVFTKLNYLKNTGLLKKQISLYKPDVLHAHYATSYGTLGSKTGFSPFVVSVWGSDVYDFPKTSILHKKIIKKVFTKADFICSTSECMKTETKKYTQKHIEVIPFGVDTSIFKPEGNRSLDKNEITIGIIKSLEPNYRVDVLIRAFNILVKTNSEKKLKLLIVGDGTKMAEYKKLAVDLGVSDRVTFTGKVPHAEVSKYHNQIDIFVSLSLKESFGVSLVEAMACGTPVVASDAEGFTEVMGDESCGIIVRKISPEEVARSIGQYIENPTLAKEKALNARKRILEKYDWNKNVEQMLTVYQSL